MIDYPVVNTHVHLRDLNLLSYPWLNDFPRIRRTFLVADYFEAVGSQAIEGMVFVQADCYPDQFLRELE